MVPKTAFFYWSGGPLPWLRAQSLISFQRHHPGWKVVLGTQEGPWGSLGAPPGVQVVLDDVSDPRLPVAARSDVWRWAMLARHGGVYADTDVIFLRPITPLFSSDGFDVWLTTDMGTPVPSGGWDKYVYKSRWRARFRVSISIGVLVAHPNSKLFAKALALSCRSHTSDDYQSHGTSLLVEHWQELIVDQNVGNIPGRAFYRGSSEEDVKRLWTETGGFTYEEYGLHWYGGSPESRPYERITSAEELPDCWVRTSLGEGLRRSDRESDARSFLA